MRAKKPHLLLLQTYLDVVQGSVGSSMFRRCYFLINKKHIEVLEDGNLSCAFYLTAILKLFSLIKEIHTTVDATEKDLRASGWREIKGPRLGCVIIYAPKRFKSGNTHRHLGFYIGKGSVVDNDSGEKSPRVHPWNYRPVQYIFWHPTLNR